MKKYCLDTNYLLRFLLKDNLKQADVVEKLLVRASEGKLICYVSVIVQMELVYVLSSFYNENVDKIKEIMESLYEMVFIEYENIDLMQRAFGIYGSSSISVQDAFLIALSLEDKMEFASFDKKAVKVFEKLR